MISVRDIPEVAALTATEGTLRIPPGVDIPLTPRVRRLIDTPAFRRLAHISQLGLVSLVYPGATHSRFEHSLGVYRMALLYLQKLSHDSRFTDAIGPADAELLIATALLHDLGHWPYCHPVEDMRLPGVPNHERLIEYFLLDGEVGGLLTADWNLDPQHLVALISGQDEDRRAQILSSMLSSPIDIDKLDYLARDSLHAGVPYGHHFDRERLISNLCLNRDATGLALTDKGKTAAELLVFARYVMFSEVYWHHSVRSATAMLQRAFYLLHDQLDLPTLFRLTDVALVTELRLAAKSRPSALLIEGLFGSRRVLYKRLAEFSFFQDEEVYALLARRPYPWLYQCAEKFADLAASRLGESITPEEILFDAPPTEKEVEFDIEIYFPKEQEYRSLEQVSPVVRALAKEQFDDYVKRVRVYAHPRIVEKLRERHDLRELVSEAAEATDDS